MRNVILAKPVKVLLISGSPTVDGSTEILLREIGKKICDGASESKSKAEIEFVRLNDLKFIACQSCARSPEPEVCFYEDELWPVYKSLIESDIVVLGSPVFFDSVSAQTKMFIDRCSCFRPPVFEREDISAAKSENPDHLFKKIGLRRRIGAGVLVAGERGRFDLAQSVMKGFFKWTEIEALGFVTYESPSFNSAGQVRDSAEALNESAGLAKALLERYLG